MPSKNDTRVVFVRRRLTKYQRRRWALYFYLFLEARKDWLLNTQVYEMRLQRGKSYMRGWRYAFAATASSKYWYVTPCTGNTTYPLRYWSGST